MTTLALSIDGTPIPAPTGIAHITTNSVGPFGGNILALGVTLMLTLIVLAALFYLVWGGIDWIMSGGDKEGIAKARAKITYALIGIAVAFLSFFIINVVGGTFNVYLIAFPSSNAVPSCHVRGDC